jgi:effector-binding domain-containing protein
MKKKYIFWIIVAVILIAGILAGPIMSNVEQARYTVVKMDGSIEIRDYPPMIVAEAELSGERKEAIRQGFRVIADYIFGNNFGSHKVAMTSPVMQEQSQKIAMTAPVMQQGDSDSWKVRFVMPSQYTIESLPTPNNPAVKLVEVPAKRFAAIRFSGLPSADNLKQREDELKAYIDQNHLVAVGQPTYAFFNPPWTLPFLRRNEVMVEIKLLTWQ